MLVSSSVTAPDAGNACGWADLDAVITALESGDTYVNVHTSDGVAPADTGPGDFPGERDPGPDLLISGRGRADRLRREQGVTQTAPPLHRGAQCSIGAPWR